MNFTQPAISPATTTALGMRDAKRLVAGAVVGRDGVRGILAGAARRLCGGRRYLRHAKPHVTLGRRFAAHLVRNRRQPDYYAMVYSTFWLEYHLWGLAPVGYHAVNVVLHALGALLLWRLLVRLRVPGAWLAVAIFAIHPVCVESIAWVTERKNTLSLMLALASMLCYLRFEPAEIESVSTSLGSRRWRYYAAALMLFALALLSKTAVVALPAVLLVVYWWKRGTFGWRTAAPLVPLFLLSSQWAC